MKPKEGHSLPKGAPGRESQNQGTVRQWGRQALPESGPRGQILSGCHSNQLSPVGKVMKVKIRPRARLWSLLHSPLLTAYALKTCQGPRPGTHPAISGPPIARFCSYPGDLSSSRAPSPDKPMQGPITHARAPHFLDINMTGVISRHIWFFSAR